MATVATSPALRRRSKAETSAPAQDEQTEALDRLLSSLPDQLLKPSMRKAAKALFWTIGVMTAGYVLLVLGPWYLMPLAWLVIGTAVTGLAAVAYDCNRNTFTQHKLVNDVIGMLVMTPICVPLESWAKHTQNARTASLSQSQFFWWLSSNWHWVKANFSFSPSKKMMVNLLFVYLFVCLFFPLMAYNVGVWGLVKFYFIPWLIYHFWMSTFVKSSSQLESELFGISKYPAWVELLSNNMNYAMSSLSEKISDMPSYHIKDVYQRAREQVDIEPIEGKWLSVFTFDWNWVNNVNWVTAIFLFSTPVMAIYGVLTTPFYWQTYLVGFLTYATGGMGITLFYHRCCSHRSYDLNRPLFYIFTFFATQTFEGSVFEWCQDHRAHHRYTDTPDDPYNIKNGFWYAHMGWLIQKRDRWSQTKADISDLKRDPLLRFQHDYYTPLALFMGFILPTLICGFGWNDWKGGFLIAGVAAKVFIMQCTFCINSVAHWWGDFTFSDTRTPRDSWFVSLFTFGEGYHNFHHEFPYDYRNGLHWYAFDPAKWCMWIFEQLGWASNLKRFDQSLFNKGKLQMAQKRLDELKAKEVWGPTDAELPTVTWEELNRRREGKDEHANFIVINDIVHDVTEFMDKHPGGRAFIFTYLGKDATKAFKGGVYNHSRAASNLLRTFAIERVVGENPAQAH